MALFKDKVVLITGGTGSLGKVLTRRLLAEETDSPAKIIIFSRDEAKQHQMRIEYQKLTKPTDEIIYHNFERLIEFRIGDVRNYHSVAGALRQADIVINAAALKQVPSCEYFPYEAVLTNITGAENIVRAIREQNLGVETVVGVSTDKACKPVNTMGMSKAIQERIWISANLTIPATRFICVRYGNVLASRGSVIPLFHEQIAKGGPLTVTTPEMTRFLLSLNEAVDTILAALKWAKAGEIYIPKIPAAKVTDIATVLIGERKIPIEFTGIRPGEKLHEILVSAEEAWRTYDRAQYFAIKPMLPELALPEEGELQPIETEFSSAHALMTPAETQNLLQRHGLLGNTLNNDSGELLR
jgi:FlaA1/EpsC-like NDP-sugar epimerase